MKFLIKTFDKKNKTLYEVRSDKIEIIENKALLYAAMGLNYKVYSDIDGLGIVEISLTGNGGFIC